jgi:hypothetical protein
MDFLLAQTQADAVREMLGGVDCCQHELRGSPVIDLGELIECGHLIATASLYAGAVMMILFGFLWVL